MVIPSYWKDEEGISGMEDVGKEVQTSPEESIRIPPFTTSEEKPRRCGMEMAADTPLSVTKRLSPWIEYPSSLPSLSMLTIFRAFNSSGLLLSESEGRTALMFTSTSSTSSIRTSTKERDMVSVPLDTLLLMFLPILDRTIR